MSGPAAAGGAGQEFGCAACWPAEAEAAAEARRALKHAAELLDESHLGISLRDCPRCGQRFVSVFVEEVDWVDGDDPQYWTLLPLTAAEAADLLRDGPPAVVERLDGLAPGRRSLRIDHPKGTPPRIYWGSGVSAR